MNYVTSINRWTGYILVGLIPSSSAVAFGSELPVQSHGEPPCHILVLDFGCPKSKRIADQVEMLGARVTFAPHTISNDQLNRYKPDGIIMSGGPSSVPQSGSPRAPQAVYTAQRPVLGICYGMQTMAEQLGGRVITSELEKGAIPLTIAGTSITNTSPLFSGIDRNACTIWMKHSDEVVQLPPGFSPIASTQKTPVAAMANESRNWYGVQFHPEASPYPYGIQMFANFLSICAQQRNKRR